MLERYGGGVFLAVGLLGVDVARTGGLLVATSSVAGSFQAGGCLGCGGGCVAGRVSGGHWGAVEVGLGGSLVVFVLLGRRVEWSPRRVDGLAVRLGFVGEWESLVRCGVGRTAWGLAATFGVVLVSGVFGVGGGWALVPVFNLVMGLPLKVACSEDAIALGDAAAATYLSVGFRLFGFDAGGGHVAARVVRLVVLPFAAATPWPAEGFTAASC